MAQINLSDEMINTLLDALYHAKSRVQNMDFDAKLEMLSNFDEADDMLRELLATA